MPLRTELKLQGLALDDVIANGKIGAWLHNVAHQRIHGTTKEKPQILLDKERRYLLALPKIVTCNKLIQKENIAIVPPVNLQHELHIYDELLTENHHVAI